MRVCDGVAQLKASALVLAVALTAALAVASAFAVPAPAQAGQPPDQPAGTPSRVQPGDRIALRLANVDVEDVMIDVNERGEIVLPRIGRMEVANLNERELRAAVIERYRELYREPMVETRILRRILVHGAAALPDVYYVDRFIGLAELIAMSGGPGERGHPHRIALIRNGERRDFKDWREAPMEWRNLQSGDELIYAEASWYARNAALILSASGLLVSIIVALGR